jgi:hypothetical protein
VRAPDAELTARAVVVATDPATAGELLGIAVPAARSLTTFWHAAPLPPTPAGELHLDGDARGPVVNSVVLSASAPSYSPDARALVATTVLGDAGDARTEAGVEDGWADLVVASPPYPNNYDYADATRIELTFLGEVHGWGDLQRAVRSLLIRSCSQHMSGYRPEADLASEALAPIRGELHAAYEALETVRRQKGGRKAYHLMVAAYFADLAACWRMLRRAVRPGGEVLLVVGDSAPYGVHLPVERWLGELALAGGFERYAFEPLRERNASRLWKSRRHDVRLHEGVLRVT